MAPVTPSPCRGLAGLGGRALLSGESDDRLVALVRAGDERALAVLVERYRQPLLRHCRRFVSASRAEDAVQQSFINAHAALMRDGPPEALRPWLHRIAQNAALNIARDRQTHMDELPEGLGGGLRTEEAVEGRDALDRLVVALKALPAAQREVIVRHELEGHSHEMIAADLGITTGAARQLAFRARSMVRNAATAVTPVGLLRRLPWIDTAAGGAEAVTGAAAGGAALTKLAAAVMAAGAVAGAGVHVADIRAVAAVPAAVVSADRSASSHSGGAAAAAPGRRAGGAPDPSARRRRAGRPAARDHGGRDAIRRSTWPVPAAGPVQSGGLQDRSAGATGDAPAPGGSASIPDPSGDRRGGQGTDAGNSGRGSGSSHRGTDDTSPASRSGHGDGGSVPDPGAPPDDSSGKGSGGTAADDSTTAALAVSAPAPAEPDDEPKSGPDEPKADDG